MIKSVRVVLTLLLVLLPASALAFGTINTLGQDAEHEKMTRLGMASFGMGSKTLNMLAGATGSFGAVGAPDNPVRGLVSTAEAHCDGGDYFEVSGYPQSKSAAMGHLRKCREWIFEHFNAAVQAAGRLVDSSGNIQHSEIPTWISCTFNGVSGRAKCDVLEAMGLVFHAAQDLYSHTNWTDRAAAGPSSPRNPPGLGNSGAANWIQPGAPDNFPDGLISGCFKFIPESQFCNYGNGNVRVKHDYLNKDKGPINPETGAIGTGKTDRGKINNNFENAVRAAIADTTMKWQAFESQVISQYGQSRGAKIVCVMRRDSPNGC